MNSLLITLLGALVTTNQIVVVSNLMSKAAGVPVTIANPLQRLRVRDGAFESLVIDDVAPLLMLPIGLALRQVA